MQYCSSHTPVSSDHTHRYGSESTSLRMLRFFAKRVPGSTFLPQDAERCTCVQDNASWIRREIPTPVTATARATGDMEAAGAEGELGGWVSSRG